VKATIAGKTVEGTKPSAPPSTGGGGGGSTKKSVSAISVEGVAKVGETLTATSNTKKRQQSHISG
jgi:hypothetical protein